MSYTDDGIVVTVDTSDEGAGVKVSTVDDVGGPELSRATTSAPRTQMATTMSARAR